MKTTLLALPGSAGLPAGELRRRPRPGRFSGPATSIMARLKTVQVDALALALALCATLSATAQTATDTSSTQTANPVPVQVTDTPYSVVER